MAVLRWAVGTSQSGGRLEVLNGGLVDGSFDIVGGFGAGTGEILVSGNNSRINQGGLPSGGCAGGVSCYI
ncbi:MAG: hypothetical protein EA419_08045 [Wenzhouxiangella sp.]|nr:MAG: hypothetical protein EA419_08045 [Wenzhouxiangella sp.]